MKINMYGTILIAFILACHAMSPASENIDSVNLIDDLARALNVAELNMSEPADTNSVSVDLQAKSVLEVDTKHNDELSLAIENFRDIRQEFQLEQIKSFGELPEEKTHDLNDLIQELNRLQIPVKTISAESLDQQVREDPPEAEIQVSVSQQELRKNPVIESSEVDLIAGIENAQAVVDPLKLADVLYRRGYYQQALHYYQQVFEQLYEESLMDRQWVLFQMANCYRDSDPQKAIQLYTQLTDQYPNSRWAEIALSRIATIQWHQDYQIKDKIVAGTLNAETK